jgi:hypothetical protein
MSFLQLLVVGSSFAVDVAALVPLNFVLREDFFVFERVLTAGQCDDYNTIESESLGDEDVSCLLAALSPIIQLIISLINLPCIPTSLTDMSLLVAKRWARFFHICSIIIIIIAATKSKVNNNNDDDDK